MDYLIYILASIGITTIVYFILLPTLKMLFYATGYTGLMLHNTNWEKAKHAPVKFIFAVFRWFWRGIVDHFMPIGKITQVSSGNWIYKPYFHYEKKNKDK